MAANRQGMVSTFASASLVGLALLAGVLWFLGTPGPVYACKCVVPGTPSEELDKFSAVFAGRVVSIQHSFDPDAGSVVREKDERTTVGFEVSAVWKGTVHEDMYITTPPTGGSCGFTFVEGEEYIVYGYDSNYDDGGYTVGICSRTALLDLAQADLDAFRAGHTPLAGTGGPAPEQPQVTARDGVEADFEFERDTEGWAVGFADLPMDYDQSIFELDHGHRPLPDGLEGSGIYVQGHNRSDDLFMFLKRHVGGLRPNTAYSVSVSIDLATNVPVGLFGIGGSPGKSVFVKAGASTVEPTAEEGDNRHLRMNIDKGNQARGGESMVVLGNAAHDEVQGREYRIKTLDNKDQPLMVETDSQGRVWLIVGTDSGFEGMTTLYYSRISYTLSTVKLPNTGGYKPPFWTVALIVGFGAAFAVGGLGLMILGRQLSRRETY